MSTDRLDRLRHCCDAYGADPARWPDALRAEFGDLIATDEAADIREDAQFLDGFLNAATAPRMSEDLTRRIAANYAPPKEAQSVLDFILGLAPVMRLAPAGALAGFAALGIASGVMSASATPQMTPEYEALAYIDALPVSVLDQEEALTWAEE